LDLRLKLKVKRDYIIILVLIFQLNIPSYGLFCISQIFPEYSLDHKIEKTEKMWKNYISLIFLVKKHYFRNMNLF